MKRSGSLSLGLVLTVPYVLLVIALAVAIGVLSYHSGSRGIAMVSEQLLREAVGRIGQAIDRHIVGSGAVLETAFPTGMPAPPTIESDFENLRTRFWIATSLHLDPNNYVYYGNEAGQGLGLFRPSLAEGQLRMKLRADERRAYYRFEGIDGALDFLFREQRLFDPRTRPWYEYGKQYPGHTWTSVYIDFGTRELVATRARRVLSLGGDFEGVVATDVSLKALNDFVGNLHVSTNGVAFIIEPDGNLIASSGSRNVLQLEDGSYTRVSAGDSGHWLVTATYEQIRDALEPGTLPHSPMMVSFVADNGESIHAAFDRVKDDAGLEWITVVAMPRRDFMAGVTANANQTVMLGSLAVLLAVGIGLAILVWVTRDLQRLSDAARKVGEGDFDAPVGIRRRDEIGDLARSFERMQHRLSTDELTGLLNREAFMQHLRKRIDTYRNDRRKKRLAVLFVDLNRFKTVNDRFGHDAGDQALKEVAQRLRQSIRTGDLIARYAGDEFVVLAEDIDARDAVTRIRENIATRLDAPLASLEQANEPVSVGAAVGVAIFPDDGDNAETLVKLADRDMYTDKNESESPT
ncbi:MAG: diguanylate cyclase domain-containing protein [Rhodocyclaceae bacterium]